MTFEEKILKDLFGIDASFAMSGHRDIEYSNDEHGDLMIQFKDDVAELYISNGGYSLENEVKLTFNQVEEIIANGYSN